MFTCLIVGLCVCLVWLGVDLDLAQLAGCLACLIGRWLLLLWLGQLAYYVSQTKHDLRYSLYSNAAKGYTARVNTRRYQTIPSFLSLCYSDSRGNWLKVSAGEG